MISPPGAEHSEREAARRDCCQSRIGRAFRGPNRPSEGRVLRGSSRHETRTYAGGDAGELPPGPQCQKLTSCRIAEFLQPVGEATDTSTLKDLAFYTHEVWRVVVCEGDVNRPEALMAGCHRRASGGPDGREERELGRTRAPVGEPARIASNSRQRPAAAAADTRIHQSSQESRHGCSSDGFREPARCPRVEAPFVGRMIAG